MSTPFKTKEFIELQKSWYRKLAKSGFKDIERTDPVGKKSGRLKTDSLKNILRSYTADEFAIKEEYYRLAGQFLYEHKFKSPTDKFIWKLHSEGISNGDIIKTLKNEGKIAYKDLVHKTIKRLTEEMKTNVSKR